MCKDESGDQGQGKGGFFCVCIYNICIQTYFEELEWILFAYIWYVSDV